VTIEIVHDKHIVFPSNINHFIIFILNYSSVRFIFLGSKLFEKLFLFFKIESWWENGILLLLLVIFIRFFISLFRFYFLCWWFIDWVWDFFFFISDFILLAVIFVELIDFLKLFESFIFHKLVICTLGCDLTFVHHNNLISHMEKVNRMSDQNSCFVFEHTI